MELKIIIDEETGMLRPGDMQGIDPPQQLINRVKAAVLKAAARVIIMAVISTFPKGGQ